MLNCALQVVLYRNIKVRLFPLCIVILSCSFLVHCEVLEHVRIRRVGLLSVVFM